MGAALSATSIPYGGGAVNILPEKTAEGCVTATAFSLRQPRSTARCTIRSLSDGRVMRTLAVNGLPGDMIRANATIGGGKCGCRQSQARPVP